MDQIEMSLFGGGNWADQADALLLRSHKAVAGGLSQFAPMEFSDGENLDFLDKGIGKRKGSTLDASLVSVLVAGDSLIRGIEWNGIQIAVGVKSIYTNQSGTWARFNDSGSVAYSHAADVSKVSFDSTDGHLFIFLDGANSIQVYKSGADLDAALNLGNTYEEIYSGTNVVTGTWATSYYIGGVFHGRLVFSTGNSVLEYTDIDQPWDRAGGGFWKCKGNIIAVAIYAPRALSNPVEYLFIFTTAGLQILAGGTFAEPPMSYPGVIPPINHQCVVTTQDWLMWMHKDKSIQAGNLYGVIDVGRRFQTGDGATGPLDTLSPTSSSLDTLPFGYYNATKKQATWLYPDGTKSVNSHAVALDLALGEPLSGEAMPDFEQRVRCLSWAIKDSTTNPWFRSVYPVEGGNIGLLAAGTAWDLESGLNDLTDVAVQSYWDTPEMIGNALVYNKQYGFVRLRFVQKGNWDVEIYKAVNRDAAFTLIGTITQVNSGTAVYDTAVYDTDTYATGQVVRRSLETQVYAEALRVRILNNDASENWVLVGMTQDYELARMEEAA